MIYDRGHVSVLPKKDYLKKEDYGKVPKYLQHIKQDIETEYQYIRSSLSL